MWPTYFNIESHLWIVYLFFLNGALLHYLFRGVSEGYRELSQPFEAQFLASFFLSITLNGLLLLVLDILGLPFSSSSLFLVFLSFGLIVLSLRICVSVPRSLLFKCDFSICRTLLYICVFLILFYNGGLIEQVSDAWWHMSFANKISLDSSFVLEKGHLNGISSRYYPPLWHGNLALAKTLSDISLPTFWNSFTSWGASLKVMAFYLFAVGLTGNKQTSVLAALLFVLLPGIGNSYLRVSAWPSHIAYTAWFSMFYVFFFGLSQLTKMKQERRLTVSRFFALNLVAGVSGVVLSIIIWFTHKVELLWFTIAVISFLVGCSISARVGHPVSRGQGDMLLRILYRLLLGIVLVVAVYFYLNNITKVNLYSDFTISFLLPIFLLVILVLIEFKSFLNLTKTTLNVLLVSVVALSLVSIDYQHLGSLFIPALELPLGAARELPVRSIGYLGDELTLPGWHLQLRQGLLFSGILSIPIALFLAITQPSRASIFLVSTSIVAILFCVSPYFYYWLRGLLAYHSSWRIALLIFHPIVIAISFQLLISRLKKLKENKVLDANN